MLHTPRRNRILAALPQREYERLLPGLDRVCLRAGSTLHGAGEREEHVHFPTAGLVCRLGLTSDGSYTGFAVTGCEGMIGVASFLGAESTLSQSLVLCDGEAYRLAAVRLRAFDGGALTQLLLRYTQNLIAQTGQMAVCSRHHSLRQRLCFWILSCVDRLDSGDLAVTQAMLAELLGVRRVGITQALGELQAAHVVRCHRGGISLIDRAGLEARACECYRALRHEHVRLFGLAA